MSELADLAAESRVWPFVEARKILDRLDGAPSASGSVLFETGYGPSGLPHIGTFAEVLRTGMVRRAFEILSDIPTRLVAFSDDMDGLRAAPDNVPNREEMERHAGKPLTAVPDPFGTHESFGHHNNARLCAFLDSFEFDYEFVSATECYRAGRFDEALLEVLRHYNEVMAIMLPSLGEERQQTYSPFLPLCPDTGQILQVPVLETRPQDGTIVYQGEGGTPVEIPVTGGNCKLQWKPDWAMRWFALGVDYEMSGKDLTDSVRLSGRICRALGGRPPEGFTYEMFLDANGEKISKSRGNGLAVEEWLAYAPPASLSLFMYRKPTAAKRLHFDVIPKTVDDYLAALARFAGEDAEKRLSNPLWHIHAGEPPTESVPVTFGLLLNLAAVCNAEEGAVLWGFLERYAPGLDRTSQPVLAGLVDCAVRYYLDFVKPKRRLRAPEAGERAVLEELLAALEDMSGSESAEDIQTVVYEIGKRHPFENLRDWFRALYEILLGQSEGPRMGSFIALYGIEETADLVRRALAGETAGGVGGKNAEESSTARKEAPAGN